MGIHLKSYPQSEKPEEKTLARKARVTPVARGSKTLRVREPISASKAKAHLLQLLEEVQRDGRPIVITKRGRIIAQLIPAAEPRPLSPYDQVFGSMKGSVTVLGDIVSPDWDSWGPEWR